MAASRGSEDVVVTPNTTEAERSAASERERSRSDRALSASAGGGDRRSSDNGGVGASSVVTVPVSVPVGTLIAGTAFNVITSDHLPHFKPMICVDNGFISGGHVDENDIKATHIVIQNPPSPEAESILPTATATASTSSWEETANMPVLSIRCKNTSAELHKSRFGSGGRGRCIKLGPLWYTPSEFEALCGRASSKDWKRSIRFGGRSIQTLINEGILTPHATSCTCGACCDDQSALGPVRLFTPYKRRRRTTLDGESEKKIKSRSESETMESDIDLNHTNSSPSKEAWQTIADGLDSNSDYHLLETTETVAPSHSAIPDASVVLKRLEDIGAQMMKVMSDYTQCVEEVKMINSRLIERLEQERASSALLAASVDAQVGVAEQAALHSLEENESKKCANCDREASAECSLCRRTPYCSIFCQRKDWGHHQIECLRSVPPMDTSQHQSIMLIVESPHQ